MIEQTARIINQAADSIEANVRCQTHTEANGKANAVDHLRQLAAEAQSATGNPSVVTDRVLSEVLAERIRQDGQFGEQNHPDGTGPHKAAIVGALCFADEAATRARRACQSAAHRGETTWRLVFAEESLEALAEDDPAKLRAELIQVAAVAVAWAEAIDRRGTQPPLTAEELVVALADVDHLNAEFPDEPADGPTPA